tara:strand:- start:1165 stop:1362 length:198 start_codon:yes stop_codon:yes gene_type:complete
MTTVFEVLFGKIDEEIESVSGAISNGSAKTYDEYQKLCGVIKGLNIAKAHVEDLRRTTEEDYEDE